MQYQQSTAQFYNRFHVMYPVVDFFLKPQKRKLAREINGLPSGHLLEIGVGNGALLPYLLKHKITGIDVSSRMLDSARKKIKNTTTVVELMDGEQLTFADATFDYIVINHVLSVTHDPEKMINESFRVLKPGGMLIIHNHITPTNGWKRIEQILAPFVSMFKFNLLFNLDSFESLRRFTFVESKSLAWPGFCKLMMFRK